MKALSLGLVRGSIDQVAQTVQINWVQPRVLDLNQLSTMQANVGKWCKSVGAMGDTLQNSAKDILV